MHNPLANGAFSTHNIVYNKYNNERREEKIKSDYYGTHFLCFFFFVFSASFRKL